MPNLIFEKQWLHFSQVGRVMECIQTCLTVQYRDACAVPPMGMIDDIAAISKCQDNSIILNSIVNAKIESKKLKFNLKKCFNMHIGPNKENCPNLKVHENDMRITETQFYLGDTISSSGYNTVNIKERCKTAHSAISQIKSMLSDVNYGRFTIQTGLLFRESILLSKVMLHF